MLQQLARSGSFALFVLQTLANEVFCFGRQVRRYYGRLLILDFENQFAKVLYLRPGVFGSRELDHSLTQ